MVSSLSQKKKRINLCSFTLPTFTYCAISNPVLQNNVLWSDFLKWVIVFGSLYENFCPYLVTKCATDVRLGHRWIT